MCLKSRTIPESARENIDGGRSNPPATARCGSLLPSAPADARASDDVITFEGRSHPILVLRAFAQLVHVWKEASAHRAPRTQTPAMCTARFTRPDLNMCSTTLGGVQLGWGAPCPPPLHRTLAHPGYKRSPRPLQRRGREGDVRTCCYRPSVPLRHHPAFMLTAACARCDGAAAIMALQAGRNQSLQLQQQF